MDSIFVTLPPWHPASIASAVSNGKAEKEKDRMPKNPVSHWRVSQKKVVGPYLRYWHSIVVCSLGFCRLCFLSRRQVRRSHLRRRLSSSY